MTEMQHLSELCDEIFTGLAPRLKASPETSGLAAVPLVGIRAITPEGLLDEERLEEFSTSSGLPKSARPLLPGDVLITIRGSAPKAALVQQPFSKPTFPSGNLAVLRPSQTKLHPSYLWSFLSNVFRKDSHPLLTRATTQQLSIRMADLDRLEVPVAPIKIQKAIGEAALALRDAVIAQQKVAAQGERTFEAFLTETFSKL